MQRCSSAFVLRFSLCAPRRPQAAESYSELLSASAQSAMDRTAELLLSVSEGSAALADVTAEATAAAASSALDAHSEAQSRIREAVWVRGDSLSSSYRSLASSQR